MAVLVVEDEPLLRMDAVDFIEEAGFEAVEADCADEAMTILRSRSDITAVFTDIEMPGGMNGIALAHAVRDGWPPMIIVIASGRVSPPTCDLPSDTRFFRKPYRATEIVTALCLRR